MKCSDVVCKQVMNTLCLVLLKNTTHFDPSLSQVSTRDGDWFWNVAFSNNTSVVCAVNAYLLPSTFSL